MELYDPPDICAATEGKDEEGNDISIDSKLKNALSDVIKFERSVY
jgi:hypothetical protein